MPLAKCSFGMIHLSRHSVDRSPRAFHSSTLNVVRASCFEVVSASVESRKLFLGGSLCLAGRWPWGGCLESSSWRQRSALLATFRRMSGGAIPASAYKQGIGVAFKQPVIILHVSFSDKKLRIGTWNVRSMSQGKLDIVKREMERIDVNLLAVSEMKWTGMGHFKSDNHEVYYCGQDAQRRNGVAFICKDEIRRCVMGSNPVSDIIATIRLQCKQVNMTALQVYAPTSTAEEEEMEEFYEKVQHVVDEIPRGDVLYVIGDWNAKVGQDETNGTTGRLGLGERNERGDQLVEFCSRNDLLIMNTFFKLHARRLYTWISPDQTTRNQIDYIICKTRWRISVRRVTTLPGAECGTDHNMLIEDVKIKLKRIKRAKQTPKYDVENIGLEFAVEVENRFNGIQLADREPEELWSDIRDIVKETTDKMAPKAKRKKVTKWLSDEAVKIAIERRDVRSKGDDKEYRRLNAAFHK